MTRLSILATILLCFGSAVYAHASQQSFVLLLPTGLYISAGVATVALTLIVISVVPARVARAIFATRAVGRSRGPKWHLATSTLSFAFLAALLLAGLIGPTDPTRNPIPAYFWTGFWMIAVLIQGLLFDIWRWINPWTGPLAIMRALGISPLQRPPRHHWLAMISLLAFAYLMLVSPRSSDPATLARVIAGYWIIHFLAGLIMGPAWLRRGEAMGLMMAVYGQLTAWATRFGRRRIGLPGWQILRRPAPPTALAVFMIALLAIGSFDGFYRTFTWFSWTGQNPLQFTGRSSVILISSLGLLFALPILIGLYAACLWAGMAMIGRRDLAGHAFRAFAPALLPIAFVYHFAHYLPALLVEVQALPIIANDPLGRGANLFGWDHLQVTTGFFNRLDTVRPIWLAQAGMVVAGHVIAILLSHVIALRLLPRHRDAAISQLPIAIFMILYTLFGLWLLASPQGA